MHLAKCLLSLAALAPVAALSSTAQTVKPACTGRYATVRISEIKPGMMDTFDKAVAGQRAFYKNGGTADEISLFHTFDGKTGTYSTTEAITVHSEIPNSPRPAEGDDYKAYVALFKASSTIKTTYETCLAK